MKRGICKVAECGKVHHGKGFCHKHLRRFNKHGDPHIVKIGRGGGVLLNKKCTVLDCGKKHLARGLCRRHYDRKYRNTQRNPIKSHGMTKTTTYRSWASMKTRCLNRNSQDYKNYGGRGIGVCNKWKNSFLSFYEDMGEKPDGLELNRINNDGNYEPNNCKWDSKAKNARNRRSTVLTSLLVKRIKKMRKLGLTYRGIAKKIGVKTDTVASIFCKGTWSN